MTAELRPGAATGVDKDVHGTRSARPQDDTAPHACTPAMGATTSASPRPLPALPARMPRARALEVLATCDVYGITDRWLSRTHDTVADVAAMLAAGVRVVQYRDKPRPGDDPQSELERWRCAYELRRLTADAGALLIVDDDAALAVAVDADGVHVGQDDLRVEAVRRVVGDRIIGLSTHSPEQGAAAMATSADYVGVGPLFATHTKANVCAPVGLAYLDWSVANQRLPFVAIGGIKEHNLEEVAAHGARCVCLVSDVVGAEDVGAKVRRLRELMARGHERRERELG